MEFSLNDIKDILNMSLKEKSENIILIFSLKTVL